MSEKPHTVWVVIEFDAILVFAEYESALNPDTFWGDERFHRFCDYMTSIYHPGIVFESVREPDEPEWQGNLDAKFFKKVEADCRALYIHKLNHDAYIDGGTE